MIYVTDTHPLIWLLEGSARLSRSARNAFDDETAQIIVPSLCLAEVAFLYARNRILIDSQMVLAHIASTHNSLLYPLDEVIIRHLPTTLNIHDAIITATAIVYRDVLGENVGLITKDAAIVASGLVTTIW